VFVLACRPARRVVAATAAASAAALAPQHSPKPTHPTRHNPTQAIEEFVDIDSEEQIDVSITSEPEVGTVYCVAVPIRRVKPEARIALNEDGDIEGLTFEYDPDDPNSDPSSQFPFGT
jgi:hypothetical protein